MPASTWKHLGIAFATLAGVSITAAVLWALYGNALIPAERLLPADTAAFVSGVSAQDLRVLSSWMPSLQQLPRAEQHQASALITVDGTLEPAILTPSRSPWNAAYDVEGSERVRSNVRGSNRPDVSLEETSAYKTLIGMRSPGKPWIYVHPALFGSGARLTPWPWLRADSPFALSIEKDGVTVSLVDDRATSVLPTLSANMPHAFAFPRFVLQGTDLPTLMENLAGALDPSVRLLSESKVAAAVRAIVGDEISIPYDILPLLGESSTLHLGNTEAGGPLRFLVEGTAPEDARDTLMTIRESFRSSLPSFRRQTMTFDDGFASDTLAMDDARLEEATNDMEGWDVRTLRHADSNRTLVTAQRGREFLVSDDPQAIEGRIRRLYGSASTGGLGGSLMAAGFIDRAVMDGMMQSLLGPSWNGSVPLPEQFGSHFVWSLTRQRKRITLRLHPLLEPPSKQP